MKRKVGVLSLLILMLILIIIISIAYSINNTNEGEGTITEPDKPITLPEGENSIYNIETESILFKKIDDLSILDTTKSGDSSLQDMLISEYNDSFEYSGSVTGSISYSLSNEKYGVVAADIMGENLSKKITSNSITAEDKDDVANTQTLSIEKLNIQRIYLLEYSNYTKNFSRLSPPTSDETANTWWHQTTKIQFDNIYAYNIEAENIYTKGSTSKTTLTADDYNRTHAVGSSRATDSISELVKEVYYEVKSINNYSLTKNSNNKSGSYAWIDPDGSESTKLMKTLYDYSPSTEWYEVNYTPKDEYFKGQKQIEEFVFPIAVSPEDNHKEKRSISISDLTTTNTLPIRFRGNRLIEVENRKGTNTGEREANVRANGGFQSDYARRDYYSYTNEYGQLEYMKAGKIIDQNDSKEETNSSGRYGEPADVYGTASEDEPPGRDNDRGHVIADSAGGAPNAYNMTPQESYLNQHGIQRNIEDYARDENTKNYTSIAYYDSEDTQTPYAYFTSYIVNGVYMEFYFLNEDPR